MPQFPHKVDIGTLQHVYVFENVLFHKPYTSEFFSAQNTQWRIAVNACAKIILKIKQQRNEYRIGYEILDF